MLKKFVFNKFYTNKQTQLGGILNMYSLSIPQHDEFYLIREFKQGFKIFGRTFYTSTDVNTFLLPFEFEELMTYWNSSISNEYTTLDKDYLPRFCDNVLDDMITNGEARFLPAYKDMLAQISEIKDSNKQDVLVARLNEKRKQISEMLGKWELNERQVNASFINSGYIPMYRLVRGATSTFYLGRYIDDRLVLIKAEYMKLKVGLTLQTVQQFSLTDDMVKTYFKKETKKGVI